MNNKELTSAQFLFFAPPPPAEILKEIQSTESGDITSDDFIQLLGYPYIRKIEEAGRAYHDFHKEEEVPQTTTKKEDDDDELGAEDIEMRKKFEKKKKTSHLDEPDYYEVLGLEKLRWRATPEHIRKAYRKKALQFHPDKNMTPEEDEGGIESTPDDTMFKTITKAYETLSNPKTRISYDSGEYFDDSVPAYGSFNDNNFYDIFAERFDAWSKWSASPAIPKLGDEKTSHAEVEKFYNWWITQFKSWRDYSFEDEYEPRESESREEKRWMERENERIRKKKKKDEKAKLMKLVDLAKKNDPRMKRRLKELEEEQKRKLEKAEKERREKLLKHQMEEEEKKRKEEEERKKKEEEELRIKKEKERIQKEHEVVKVAFRKLYSPITAAMVLKSNKKGAQQKKEVAAEDVEYLLMRLSLEELQAFVASLEGKDTGFLFDQFNEKIAQLRKAEEERLNKFKQQEQEQKNSQKKEAQSKEWTTSELSLLSKAIAMYPGGTQQRWVKVAQFVKTRTPEEVQEKTGEIRKMSSRGAFIPKTNEAQHFEDFKESKKKTETATKRDITSQEDQKSAETSKVINQQTATTTAAPKAKPEENWSNEQQKLLEKGLKEVKPADPKRWELIAQIVGKPKEECVARFNYCKQLAMQKRQTK